MMMMVLLRHQAKQLMRWVLRGGCQAARQSCPLPRLCVRWQGMAPCTTAGASLPPQPKLVLETVPFQEQQRVLTLSAHQDSV